MRYLFGTTLVVVAFLVPSLANAQNCREKYGRAGIVCAVAQNPKLAAKLERCKEEGRAMGLRSVRGENSLGPFLAGACGVDQRRNRSTAPRTSENIWLLPLLAQSVSLRGAGPCPLSGAKPACRLNARTSHFDPKRTSVRVDPLRKIAYA